MSTNSIQPSGSIQPSAKPLTQRERLAAIITGSRYWTLFEIQQECLRRFGKTDSETALSARFRDMPLNKRVKRLREGSKHTFEYRLEA
ncbi:hypothetical protein [Shewanella acanthi]|uniref:hypothetical protein n=1 Tax=Shewanella acanthi TaxID=2864212 RepID=UPI001C65D764|nr:hypothetical protein [Shewanella acanthi]QYJ79412.1 hypothetical protein K0H61_02900 [Shewanella acanthi]